MRYHLHIEEAPDWTFGGGTLTPLKAIRASFWEGPSRANDGSTTEATAPAGL
jgi:hypothetical protein